MILTIMEFDKSGSIESIHDGTKRSELGKSMVVFLKKWFTPTDIRDLPLVADPELVEDAIRLGADENGYLPIYPTRPYAEVFPDWKERVRNAFGEELRNL